MVGGVPRLEHLSGSSWHHAPLEMAAYDEIRAVDVGNFLPWRDRPPVSDFVLVGSEAFGFVLTLGAHLISFL